MTAIPPAEPAPDAPDVAGAYDRWAATYDDDANATRDLDAAVLRGAPLALADRDVLEIGCGTGKNTTWLAQHARRVVAMDFSAGMLARARTRITAEHVRFVQHDVRAPWPLPDTAVDLVVGNLILEHVADLGPIYTEAVRVLRSGGQLYLCELHPYRQWRGGQAHFQERATGETIHVPAHVHSVGEYINGGITAGLVLQRIGEWIEPGAAPGSPPRLLSVVFERR